RRDFPHGRYPLRIEESRFSLKEYETFIEQNAAEISAFTQQREQAFDEELARWHANGQFNYEQAENIEEATEDDIPEGAICVDSSVSGSVWQAQIQPGQTVNAGDLLLILESMKMEINITAPCAGKVTQVLKGEGSRVQAGQTLVVMESVE